MVDRIIAPEDIHVLIWATCEHAMLHGEGTLGLWKELRFLIDFEMRKLSWII